MTSKRNTCAIEYFVCMCGDEGINSLRNWNWFGPVLNYRGFNPLHVAAHWRGADGITNSGASACRDCLPWRREQMTRAKFYVQEWNMMEWRVTLNYSTYDHFGDPVPQLMPNAGSNN
jgi:hypothetical protein